jgi:hypothetical protein
MQLVRSTQVGDVAGMHMHCQPFEAQSTQPRTHMLEAFCCAGGRRGKVIERTECHEELGEQEVAKEVMMVLEVVHIEGVCMSWLIWVTV